MAAILIIDEDVQFTAMLAAVLRAEGHQVRVALDGNRGIRMASTSVPDVILLDLWTPPLDGSGVVYRLHFMGEGLELVPVVLLSDSPDLAGAAAQLGTPYYVAKPPTLGTLMPVLARAILARIPPTPVRPFELRGRPALG